MPPPVSEDEFSSEDIEHLPKPTKSKATKEGATLRSKEEPVIVVDEDEEDIEPEDDESLSDDEFIVEAIKNHIIDEEGVIRFQVKWKGYEKRSDLTWEPEENLTGTASEILNDYYESVGGRDFVLHSGIADEEKTVKSKKRGRSSTGVSANGKKKRTSHPKSGTPPVSVAATFRPPSGSWEEDIASIDACEDNDGNVMVFLQWQTGQRTQHPLQVVYKRCPQKMLKFYESHLVFKKGGGTSKENSIDGD